MTKSDALTHWKNLKTNINPLRFMRAIPYKSTGSKYGACGIRIDGSPEFIDAVLSNLKGLINGENGQTRLELSRNPVKDVTIQGKTKRFDNSANAAEVCYIRLHMRGNEARYCNILTGDK